MCEQKKAEEFGITEDDVSEIRQDINKFRFELVEILRKNRFDIGTAGRLDGYHGGRRAKQMERRILKGFNVDIHDLVKDAFAKQDNTKKVDIFKVMADAINKNSKSNKMNSQLNHIQFSNEESINYSPATITAAKKFKRSLVHKKTGETNGKRASSVRKENGRAVSLKKTGSSPNSRGIGRTAILANDSPPLTSSPSAGAKEGMNTQMLNAAVIPCTITLNVPVAENNVATKTENSEEENDSTVEKRQRLLLERTAVRSLGRSDAIDENGLGGGGGKENGQRELLTKESKGGSLGKLTSVRRAGQVTSGWI